MTKKIRAFTLVELLVVIAIIGVLVALLLPAVQAVREAARRAQCQHHLVQIAIAVNNYEMSHTSYPAGTVAAAGPVRSVAQGRHHSWTTLLLPYLEQQVVYRHIDSSVSVYDAKNAKVRAHNVGVYRCPSAWLGGSGYSDYAGLQHDLEAPIDIHNDGVFFLNSRVRYQDVSDGTSQTFFFGEKLATAGDLGWMSGTRATLRNTGTPLNAAMQLVPGQPPLRAPTGAPRSQDVTDDSDSRKGDDPDADDPDADDADADDADADDADADDPDADDPDADDPDAGDPDSDAADADEQEGQAAVDTIQFGLPIGPLAVGGFGSDHPAGANFAFGDGSVRFMSETMSTTVYQQLGNRHDGQLIDGDY